MKTNKYWDQEKQEKAHIGEGKKFVMNEYKPKKYPDGFKGKGKTNPYWNRSEDIVKNDEKDAKQF